MPFTPSHVAAVLPLRGRGRSATGRGLPLAALAAGSMSPDLPYDVPWLVPFSWRARRHPVAGRRSPPAARVRAETSGSRPR